jgi:hypothetical protein
MVLNLVYASSIFGSYFKFWCISYQTFSAEVGTRYFFLSPLPLVRYLEIVLPLRAGPLFSKI